MSSLKEKTKMLRHDLTTIFNLSGLVETNLLFKDVFEYCRNASKDTQQEIDKLRNDYEALSLKMLADKLEKERERGLQKQKLQSVLEMLRDIAGKYGPYSQDTLTHAENVMNQSSSYAKKILLIIEELLK